MNDVEMPALTGDSPLGILAAIGVLRLLSDFTDDDPRLRWDPRSFTAVLSTSRTDVSGIVDALQRIVSTIPRGAVLPGVVPGFPPEGGTKDGMRVPQVDLRTKCAEWFSGARESDSWEGLRWVASLVTDLAVDNKKDNRVAISRFTAPSGQQKMISMLKKPLEAIQKDPNYLRQALLRWQRVSGVTGEYLDHRAMWSAAEDGSGVTGSMRGVPGATWLALMSYPLFRTTISPRGERLSSGWHAASQGGYELRLPVWVQPIGPAAVTALIEHPALTTRKKQEDRGRNELSGSAPQLAALGIVHVCRARRDQSSDSNSAGVLVTVT